MHYIRQYIYRYLIKTYEKVIGLACKATNETADRTLPPQQQKSNGTTESYQKINACAPCTAAWSTQTSSKSTPIHSWILGKMSTQKQQKKNMVELSSNLNHFTHPVSLLLTTFSIIVIFVCVFGFIFLCSYLKTGWREIRMFVEMSLISPSVFCLQVKRPVSLKICGQSWFF